MYEDLKDDEFVDIKDYEGIYKINKSGEVFAMDRYTSNGFCKTLLHARILKRVKSTNGYYVFSFYKNGCKKMVYLHILMAQTFLPNPNKFTEINHKNGIKSDSRLCNLEWCTHRRNMQHACDYGLNKGPLGRTGVLSHSSKLVLDLNTGIYYFGVREAATSKEMSYSKLSTRLRNIVHNDSGLIYV